MALEMQGKKKTDWGEKKRRGKEMVTTLREGGREIKKEGKN